MTEDEIERKVSDIRDMLRDRRLKEAHHELAELLADGGEWQLKERLKSLQTTYDLMLSYMRNGVVDPDRASLYKKLVKQTWDLADQTRLRVLDGMSTAYVVNVRRKYAERASALPEWVEAVRRAKKASEVDQALDDLFLATWTNGGWTSEEQTLAEGLLADDEWPTEAMCLLVSGATLCLTECFDARKLHFLLVAYRSTQGKVRQRALAGIAIAMHLNALRVELDPDLPQLMKEMDAHGEFAKDLNRAFLALLLSQVTPEVEKKLKEEILPEISKKVEETLETHYDEEDDPEEELFDPNPDWLEKMADWAVHSKGMKSLNDLQASGADINRMTFSRVKDFPFFKRPCNWLRPFDIDVPNLKRLKAGSALPVAIADALMHVDLLCDSDKYSLCFMIKKMPEDEIGKLAQEILPDVELPSVDSLIAASQPASPRSDDSELTHYVQDLYRLLTLSPHHDDMRNFFSDLILLHTQPVVGPMLSRIDLLNDLAHFYLRWKRYLLLGDLCRKLTYLQPDNPDPYRLWGFCEEQGGYYDRAIESYKKADLLEPDHAWTLRHMAICYNRSHKTELAVACYDRLLELNPEDEYVLLRKAHYLLDLKRTEEALQCFFRLYFVNENCVRAWRGIGWCSFLLGKYDQAARYFEKAIAADTNDIDRFDRGHVAWLTEGITEATKWYEQGIAVGDYRLFADVLAEDTDILVSKGIPAEDIDLMFDIMMD